MWFHSTLIRIEHIFPQELLFFYLPVHSTFKDNQKDLSPISYRGTKGKDTVY